MCCWYWEREGSQGVEEILASETGQGLWGRSPPGEEPSPPLAGEGPGKPGLAAPTATPGSSVGAGTRAGFLQASPAAPAHQQLPAGAAEQRAETERVGEMHGENKVADTDQSEEENMSRYKMLSCSRMNEF